MKIKEFLRNYHYKFANLAALVLMIYSPTSNSGNIVRYLLLVPVFIVYAISLYISLKTAKDIKIFSRILCRATIVLLFVAIINSIYQIYKIII